MTNDQWTALGQAERRKAERRTEPRNPERRQQRGSSQPKPKIGWWVVGGLALAAYGAGFATDRLARPVEDPLARWELVGLGHGEVSILDHDLTLEDCYAAATEMRKHWGTDVTFACEER